MKKTLLILLLLNFVFFDSFAQQSNQTLPVDGVTRNYIKYLPTNFNQGLEKLPLIIVLHGLGGNASGMTGAGFRTVADTARAIIVYPNGTPNAFGQNGWANETLLESQGVDDVKFINLLIDEMKSTHDIDLTKVYIAGLSMGGIMTYKLVCELSHRIAAAASMTGTVATNVKNNCDEIFKTPFIHWHGTADQTVPYENNPLPSLETVPSTINMMKNLNQCDMSDSTIIPIPDIRNDGITVDRIVYNCQSALELWRFNGGGHDWFRNPNNDVDGATEFWNFFRQFSRADAPPTTSNLSEIDSKINLYPNPVNSNQNFVIDGEVALERLIITNFEGKIIVDEVFRGMIYNYHFSLNKSGLYIISLFDNNGGFQTKKLIVN